MRLIVLYGAWLCFIAFNAEACLSSGNKAISSTIKYNPVALSALCASAVNQGPLIGY